MLPIQSPINEQPSASIPNSAKAGRIRIPAHVSLYLCSSFHLHQPHIDILPARRVMAVHRYRVFPLFKRSNRFRADRDFAVIRHISTHLRRQYSVEIDFGVLVVVQIQIQIVVFAFRQLIWRRRVAARSGPALCPSRCSGSTAHAIDAPAGHLAARRSRT